ncbi:hypothetical protein A2U01_0077165, partial [Trifolium medium]|nr:hypothetical protein [Trifolium medium]
VDAGCCAARPRLGFEAVKPLPAAPRARLGCAARRACYAG